MQQSISQLTSTNHKLTDEIDSLRMQRTKQGKEVEQLIVHIGDEREINK
jgi:hypothetical protein